VPADWTPEREAAIRARLAAATPGPWVSVGVFVGTSERDSQTVAYADDHRNRKGRDRDTKKADASLIANAPADLADALDEIVRLRARLDDANQRAAMGCENPDPNCDCPGCGLAAELAGREVDDG
jgi:hypothetical protein